MMMLRLLTMRILKYQGTLVIIERIVPCALVKKMHQINALRKVSWIFLDYHERLDWLSHQQIIRADILINQSALWAHYQFVELSVRSVIALVTRIKARVSKSQSKQDTAFLDSSYTFTLSLVSNLFILGFLLNTYILLFFIEELTIFFCFYLQ